VVQISKGQQFLHFRDSREDRIFHDLFSIDDKSKVPRMNDDEFKEYIKSVLGVIVPIRKVAKLHFE
jgi:hypothetical protein